VVARFPIRDAARVGAGFSGLSIRSESVLRALLAAAQVGIRIPFRCVTAHAGTVAGRLASHEQAMKRHRFTGNPMNSFKVMQCRAGPP
jgi:hypothetical protein